MPKYSFKHALSENALAMTVKDLDFLLEKIRKSSGELDLQLRDGYFNVYYKGNSLAKIKPMPDMQVYEFSVNKVFELRDIINGLEDPRLKVSELFRAQNDDNIYDIARVPFDIVHPFFQTKVVVKLSSNIKKRGYGEEITFEQSLITDNLDNQNFIIIDRQVAMRGQRTKMDLLALERDDSGKYRFVVLEVKLGNNPELSNDVAKQLEAYMDLIQSNFSVFREAYHENYRQKREFGILGKDNWPADIDIVEPVNGRIVVGLYSGIGKRQVKKLLETHSELRDRIDCFWNRFPRGRDRD